MELPDLVYAARLRHCAPGVFATHGAARANGLRRHDIEGVVGPLQQREEFQQVELAAFH